MKKRLLFLFLFIAGSLSLHAQLSESFNGTTFPPSGWLNLHSQGPDATALWERTTSFDLGGNTYNVTPHSGAGMAMFRAYDFPPGNGAYLITAPVDLSSGGPHLISFWMYRDDNFETNDSISVYVNTSASVTDAAFLGKVLRKKSDAPVETGPDGWYKYSLDIPAGYNTATNYFIFSAYSDYGDNMFIDDISVEAQGSCGTPMGITTNNFNYAAGTINASWSAPSNGTPLGYEWAITTTASEPSLGTAASGTTVTIPGITPDVVNYIYIRTDCGSGTFSSWEYYAFASLPCATTIAPIDGATDVPADQSFSWNAVTGADSYNFYLGPAPGSETGIGSTANTAAVVSDLVPGQTYYWYIVPLINGVAAPADCTANSFTVAAEPLTPPNNPCSGAINIGAANNASKPITATTTGATLTLPGSDCQGATPSPDDDVWFEFTTSASTVGNITITPRASGGITDIVAQVYASTSCGSLGLPVMCADATIDNGSEVIDISMLAPNTHYFMRVFSFSNQVADEGDFTITASMDNTLPIALSAFTANRSGEVNILNWTTSQELNTDYFAIERSSDGITFNEIGQVTAAGNSVSLHTYRFIDPNPMKGLNYYRLKIVDIDNGSKYSLVRSVKNLRFDNLTLYPNPARTDLQVDIESDRTDKAVLSITDINGRRVYRSQVNLSQGTNTIPVDVSRFAKGSYFIKIQLATESIMKKFAKQ